jgi:hypothetical protein
MKYNSGAKFSPKYRTQAMVTSRSQIGMHLGYVMDHPLEIYLLYDQPAKAQRPPSFNHI